MNMNELQGEVAVLNVGDGDTKLSFDPSNPAECIRAARIVKDMLRRGYALLVQTGTGSDGKPIYQRAVGFDDTKYEYIIADLDPAIAAAADMKEERDGKGKTHKAPDAKAGKEKPRVDGRTRAGRKLRRLPAKSTRAVSVGRSAGG